MRMLVVSMPTPSRMFVELEVSQVESANEFPFPDFDPVSARGEAETPYLARALAGQRRSAAAPDPRTVTLPQLLAYIRQQYRLGEQRQNRIDEQRRREARAARARKSMPSNDDGPPRP
jgi:hypothetical protein